METIQLWLEYKSLRDKCISVIGQMMHGKKLVKFAKPIATTKEAEVHITGLRNRSGKTLILTKSFGILVNIDYPPNDYLFTVQDYLSIIEQLEDQL